MPASPLKRGMWIVVLGALLSAGSGILYFLNVVLVDDRAVPFPSVERQASPGVRESFLSWTTEPPIRVPSSSSHGDLSRVLADHPEAHFRWRDEALGVARVTLADPPGQTRLVALVAEAGSAYVWSGKLPAGSALEFRTGILSQGDAFQFRVDLEDETGQSHPLFSKTMPSPRHRSTVEWTRILPSFLREVLEDRDHGDERWSPARVDVSAWAGRSVRVVLRVDVSLDPSRPSPGIAFWGDPGIWFPPAEKRSSLRRTRDEPPAPPVVLAVLETSPQIGGFSDGIAAKAFPRWEAFLRESTLYSRFYTTDTRSEDALRGTLFSPSFAPENGEIFPSWPALLGERGYRSLAVGAFSEEMMSVLSDAGFDEIHRLPHDGRDAVLAAGRAVEWVRDQRHGPQVVLAYFRNVPSRRCPPVRFWAFSLERFPWSPSRWVLWRRATDSAYVNDYVGRLAEGLDSGVSGPLLGVVSLRGEVLAPMSVRWSKTERRGKIFFPEGGGLRESEIRTVFALRHRVHLGPRLYRDPGSLSDVGPVFFQALDLPFPNDRRRSATQTQAVSGGPWVVRSPWAKAVIVDGRYKYIRHGPSRKLSVSRWGRSVKGLWSDHPAEEIFDVWSDPEEQDNLVRSRRHLLARMRKVMEEEDPDPVEIRFGFTNPSGEGLRGVVTCSGGKLSHVWGTFPLDQRGPYEFSFTTNISSGTFAFRTLPPDSSYSLRFHIKGRPLRSSELLVSRWGLPFFESTWNEWHDKTNFIWMEGWIPPPLSSSPVGSLGRVPVGWNGEERGDNP